MSLTIPPGFAGRVANTDVSTPKKIKNQREPNVPTYKYSKRETTQHSKFFAQKRSGGQYTGDKNNSTLSFSVPHRVTITSNIWVIEKYNNHLKLDGDVIRATVGYINHCDSMAIALSLAQNLTKCTGKTLKYDCGPYNACLSRALALCSFKELPVQVDKILAQMRRLNVNHDDITAINLLTIYKATKNHSEAQRLVLGKGTDQSYINVWKIDLNIKICNALMGVYGNLDEEQITGEIAQEIDDFVKTVLQRIAANKVLESPDEKMLPNAITANNLLGVYKVRKNLSDAKLLVFGTGNIESIIDGWGIHLNKKIYNALMGVFANLDEKQITEETEKEIDGIVERVLKLIKDNKALESPDEQMLPDAITAVNLLGVYKVRKDPSAAKLLVLGPGSIIKRWGVPLNNKICCALLGVCANLDEDQITEKTEKEIDDIVERVLKLIKDNKALESPNGQMLPNAITAVNLLGVYKVRKNPSAAKLLVFGTGDKESIIDSWGIPLTNKICSALLGVYANLDEAQITGEIAQEIDGIVKTVLERIAANKAHESPDEQMLPDAITAVNLLGVYKVRKKPSAARLLVLGPGSIIKLWKVPLNNKICCAFLGVFANLDEEQITDKIATQIDYIVRMVLQHIEKNKFLELPDEQMLPNAITAVNLLGVYKVRNKPSAAKFLVFGTGNIESIIDSWGIPVTNIICCALLRVCANLDEDQITEKTEKEIDDIVEKVLKLIKDNKKLASPDEKMLPNAITAINLLGIYKVRKDPSAAKLLVFGTGNIESNIDGWGIHLNNKIYNALLGACANLDEEQITGEIAQEIDGIVERVLKLIKDNKALESPDEQMLPDAITAVNLLGVYKV